MIATVCDEGDFLFRVTRPAVLSFAKHMPASPFCLVLVNGTGRYDDELRRWHPRLILKSMPLSIRPEHLRGYQFCYMTLPLHDLLREFDEPLVYVDADTLLRGSLAPVFEMLSHYDIVMRYLPFQELPGPTTARDGARVNNGCLGLANNERTRRYTAELRRRVIEFLNNGRNPSHVVAETGTVTGLDQELLWVIYQEMRGELRFFPLDDRYNDSQLLATSILWHAKGTARRNPRYLFEAARHCRDYGRMLRILPRKFAMDAFRALRTRKWRRNLTAAFRIPQIFERASKVSKNRLLVVNSCFLRFNPELSQFRTIDCIDVDPAWYYLNKRAIEHLDNVRHTFLTPDDSHSMNSYDLVVTDRAWPTATAAMTIQQLSDNADDLLWRRTKLLRRGSRIANATAGAGA